MDNLYHQKSIIRKFPAIQYSITLYSTCCSQSDSSQSLESDGSQSLKSDSSQSLESDGSQSLKSDSSQSLESDGSQFLKSDSSQSLESDCLQYSEVDGSVYGRGNTTVKDTMTVCDVFLLDVCMIQFNFL